MTRCIYSDVHMISTGLSHRCIGLRFNSNAYKRETNPHPLTGRDVKLNIQIVEITPYNCISSEEHGEQ